MWKEIFDRNTMFGIILISVMVSGYLYWTKKKFEDKVIEQKIQQSFKPELTDTTSISADTPKDTISETEQLVQNNMVGKSVSIENELVLVSFNTKGAYIENAKLKKDNDILQAKKGVILQEESSKPYLFGPDD